MQEKNGFQQEDFRNFHMENLGDSCVHAYAVHTQ